MLIQDEFNKIAERIKNKTLSDLYNPSVPKIKAFQCDYPETQDFLNNHLNCLNKAKSNCTRVFWDDYPNYIRYLERVKGAFIDIRMKSFWNNLCEKSIPITLKFIELLLSIEKDYKLAAYHKEVQKRELDQLQKILNETDALIRSREQGQTYCFRRFMIDESYDLTSHELYKSRTTLIKQYESVKKSYDDYPSNFPNWFITRKCKSKNSLAITFIRSMYYFFIKNFDKPMYKEIDLITQVIFKINHTENYISKLVKIVRSDLENSAEK